MVNHKRISITMISGLLAEIFNKFIPLFLYNFALKKIGAGGFAYAIYGVSLVEAALPFVIMGYNFQGSLEVGKSKDNPQALRKIISNVTSLKLIHALFVIFFFLALTSFIPSYAPYRILMLALSFAFLTGAFECLWVHIGIQKMTIVNFWIFISRVISLFLIVWLIKGPQDATLFAALLLSSNGMIGIFTTVYILRKYPLKRPKKTELSNYTKLSIGSGLLVIATTLISKIDMILAERIFNLQDTGFYAGASRLEHSITMIMSVLFMTFFSEIVGLKSHESLQKHLRMSTLLSWTILCPIAFGSFLVGDQLLSFVFSPSFAQVSLTFSILLLGTVAFMLIQIFGIQVLVIHKATKSVVTICFISIALTALLAWPLGQYQAFTGLAIAVSLGKIISALFCMFKARQFIKIPYVELCMPLLPSLGMSLLILALPKQNLFVSLTIGVVSYIIFWKIIFPKSFTQLFSTLLSVSKKTSNSN